MSGAAREEVPAALDGERVDRVVALVLDCSRQEAAALLAAGEVQVGGKVVAKGSLRLHEGDVLEVASAPPEKDPRPVPDPDVPVAVVHEDPEVLVVDKPAGMVVHPGSGNDHRTLVHGLVARYPEVAEVGEPDRPGIVHRLDVGTSGLLAVARTPGAYESLTEQLGGRTVERRYDVLVWGHPDADAGLIDAPIGRSPRRRTSMAVSADGRDARTRYEVLHRYPSPEVALLSCTLETGRTHQIRVHLQAIGHPVVGDDRYRGARPALPAPRPMLHAAHLGFEHPTTGERLAFDAPRPDDLVAVLDDLAAAEAEG